MEIIKFDLNELEKVGTGFNYYLLGRSYDLEENGVEKDYDKALYYYQKVFLLSLYQLLIFSPDLIHRIFLKSKCTMGPV